MQGLTAFAKDSLGLELWPGQVEVLEGMVASGKSKTLLALGRRSGKTLMAGVTALYNALVEDYTGLLRPSEQRYIVSVAVTLPQARGLIRTVRSLVEDAPDPDIRGLIDLEHTTQDEIVFRTGVTIRAIPCSSRSSRGLPISLLILDEAAHMNTTEDGPAAGKEVYRALLPSVAQFHERGYAMVLSTPLWCTGIFWELFQAGVTGADDIYVSQRPTWTVNPSLPRESEIIESAFRSDPDYARREFGAEFIEGAGAFMESARVRDCVVPGRTELPPVPGRDYIGAADPAFAAGGDRFTFAIGHEEQTSAGSVYVVDCLRAWQGRHGPLNSDEVLDEIAGLAHYYGIVDVISDQYAVVPLSDGMRRRGINLVAQPLTNELKADIFTSTKRAISNGLVELLDDEALVGELINLEVRPTAGGKMRIQASGHFKDDRAMAVATVIHSMAREDTGGWVMAFGDEWSSITTVRGDTATTVTKGEPADELQWTPMRW